MNILRELTICRCELTRYILNNKNISKEEFAKVRKALLDIKEICYKLKNEKNFNCVDRANEIKQFTLGTKKVGK